MTVYSVLGIIVIVITISQLEGYFRKRRERLKFKSPFGSTFYSLRYASDLTNSTFKSYDELTDFQKESCSLELDEIFRKTFGQGSPRKLMQLNKVDFSNYISGYFSPISEEDRLKFAISLREEANHDRIIGDISKSMAKEAFSVFIINLNYYIDAKNSGLYQRAEFRTDVPILVTRWT